MTELTSKLPGFSGPHEFTKPVGSKKNPPLRAVSKIWRFSVRIHWFRVDGRPIKFVLKRVRFKNYPDSCGRGIVHLASEKSLVFGKLVMDQLREQFNVFYSYSFSS